MQAHVDEQATIARTMVLRDPLLIFFGKRQIIVGHAWLRTHHTIAQVALHTRIEHCTRSRIGAEVHIREGDHAKAQHLGNAEQRSVIGRILRDMRLEREDSFIEPAIERQIIPAATQECHGNMRMRVVECWHQELAAAINRAIEGAFGLRELEMRDSTARHTYISVRDGLPFFGQDRDVLEEQ